MLQLAILATAEEFQSVKFRMGEAALYKKLSEAHGLKYHVNNPDKDARKIVLIVQAELGGISYPSGAACEKNGVQYRQDVFSIFANIHRLIRCFVDTRCILGDGVSVKNGLEMSRSLAAKAWDNSPLILKQLPSVGPVTMRKFQQLGIKTIEDLKVTPVHKLDKCSTTSLFGTKLLDTLEKFPVLRISASILSQVSFGSWLAHYFFLTTHRRTQMGLRSFIAKQKSASSIIELPRPSDHAESVSTS